MRKPRNPAPGWRAFLQGITSQLRLPRFPVLADGLAPFPRECPRCGGAGCKECRHQRAVLEHRGCGPDDPPGERGGDGTDEFYPEGGGNGDDEPAPGFGDGEGDVDGDEPPRRRRETEGESFARRLAMGVSMLAEGDDSILDD